MSQIHSNLPFFFIRNSVITPLFLSDVGYVAIAGKIWLQPAIQEKNHSSRRSRRQCHSRIHYWDRQQCSLKSVMLGYPGEGPLHLPSLHKMGGRGSTAVRTENIHRPHKQLGNNVPAGLFGETSYYPVHMRQKSCLIFGVTLYMREKILQRWFP